MCQQFGRHKFFLQGRPMEVLVSVGVYDHKHLMHIVVGLHITWLLGRKEER
jgi:hypothetical protein